MARNCQVDRVLHAEECSERQENLKWLAANWAAKERRKLSFYLKPRNNFHLERIKSKAPVSQPVNKKY